MKNIEIIYFGIFFAHALFYVFALFWIFRREPDEEKIARIHPGRETRLWAGKVTSFFDGEAEHQGQMDAIVYHDGFYIGYADQGYPLLYAHKDDLSGLWVKDKSLKLSLKANHKKKQITLKGEAGQIEMLGKKLAFIMKRRTIQWV